MTIRKKRPPPQQSAKEPRVNERIRISEVRVIAPGGEQLGIMPTDQARSQARELGLDLVEVAPTSAPPVCRIMDFGKYKYEQKKKQADARKKQTVVHIKEVKFRPKIEEHDFQFKMRHIGRFLADGDKVKATIMFRGREMAHTDIGSKILERVRTLLAEEVVIEQPAKLEGRNMTMLVAPRPQK